MTGQVWLHSNRRAAALGAIPLVMSLLAGWWLAVWSHSGMAVVTGWLLVALSAYLLLILALGLRRPRLAYRDGQLLVHLRAGSAIAVPIEVVECFFLGQGPALIGSAAEDRQTATIVVRLAERATDWHSRAVQPRLGVWCEGYITIRGTWCEPLSGELVRRLNQRLVAAHRAQRAATKEPA